MPRVDDVVASYVKLRDHKKKIEGRHKEELAPINDNMRKIEGWLHRELLAQGVDSFKTNAGTAFVQKATSCKVQDWDATLEFIKETGQWEFLEARVSKTVVADWIESYGSIPPGVDFTEEQVVRIRR